MEKLARAQLKLSNDAIMVPLTVSKPMSREQHTTKRKTIGKLAKSTSLKSVMCLNTCPILRMQSSKTQENVMPALAHKLG